MVPAQKSKDHKLGWGATGRNQRTSYWRKRTRGLTNIPLTRGSGQPLWVHTGVHTMKIPESSEYPNTLSEAHSALSDHLQNLTRWCLTCTQEYHRSPLSCPLLQVPSAVPISGCYVQGSRPKGPHLSIPDQQGLIAITGNCQAGTATRYVRPAPCPTHNKNPDTASMGRLGKTVASLSPNPSLGHS